MAKRGRPRKDEQWPLIETTPKNAKAIVKIATAYKEAQKERCHWGGKEVEEKDKLLAAVREAKITPDADGTCRFKVNGCAIKVTPRDELVQVRFENDADGE